MSRISACLAAATFMLADCYISHASETTEFVNLVSGGSQLCCDFNFSPFTDASIESMTDGSTGSGFTYTSVGGNPIEGQTFGIQKQFVFDVSQFRNIEKIDVSWTGTYEWPSGAVNSYPEMRLGVSPYYDFIGIYGLSLDGYSTGNIASGMRSFTGTSLADITSGPLASAWIATGFGSADSTIFSSLSVTTLEVTAKVTGVRIPEPTTVAHAFLILFGLSFRPLRKRA